LAALYTTIGGSIPAEHDGRGGLGGVHHPLAILAALFVATLLALWIVLEAQLYIGYGTSTSWGKKEEVKKRKLGSKRNQEGRYWEK
jgi:hypothetical protein